MEMMIYVAVSLVLGFLIGLLVGNNGKQRAQTKADMLQAQVEKEKTRYEEAEQRFNAEKKVLEEDQETRVEQAKQEERKHFQDLLKSNKEAQEEALKAQRQVHETAIAEQDKRHNEAMEAFKERLELQLTKMRLSVNTTTEELLQKRQEEFSTSSKEQLNKIVDPLKETLTRMKTAIENNTLKQTELGGKMSMNVANMIAQSQSIQKTTEELTRAFKHNGKVQGDWGETILNDLLDHYGFTRGVEYDTQVVLRDMGGKAKRTDEGKSMRVDALIYLGDNREVIVDSKVSLTAYMGYLNTEVETEKAIYLKEHLDSVKKHIKELAEKDYSAYVVPPKVAMDYVIMFVPNIGALNLALDNEPTLWHQAMKKRVLITDERSLTVVLQIIRLIWTQIKQEREHKQVFELAEELLNRVGQFTKHYNDLGAALKKAVSSYHGGQQKLAPSGQSIVTTCYKMEKLGAKQNATNPIQAVEVEDIKEIEVPPAIPVSQEENDAS